MREYTSLEVSKRLKAVGFEERAEYGYWQLGAVDVIGSKIRSSANWGPRDTRLVCRSYRSDTLLAWLLERGLSVTTVKGGGGFMYASVNYFTTSAVTLCDALAEQVLKVLEVSK